VARLSSASIVRIGLAGGAAAALASLVPLAGARTTPTYRPSLSVSPAPAGSVRFEVRRSATDLATYTTEIRVPHAYGATLGQPVGTVIGHVRAGSAPDSGTLTVAKPDPGNGCFSVADGDTAWDVDLDDGTRTLTFQIYLLPFAGDVTLLRYCLPPDATELESIAYTVTGVFREPARGTQVWRAQLYPYTAGGEIVDNATGVGAAALVRLPHVVTLAASYSGRTHRYVVHGSVTESGSAVGNAPVRLSSGTKGHALRAFARVTTDAKGRFSFTGKLSAKNPVRFRASARVAARAVSAPRCAPINGWPCTTETASSWAHDSHTVVVRP
jgi:hypothetical protein